MSSYDQTYLDQYKAKHGSYAGIDDWMKPGGSGNPEEFGGQQEQNSPYPTAGGLYGGGSTAPGSYGAAPANNSQQLTDLYAGVGKTGGLGGGLVDQQGWDYWSGRQNAGEDITGAFNSSAQTTYSNMLQGEQSPYQSSNVIGFNNLLKQQPQGAGAGGAGQSGGYKQTGPAQPENPYTMSASSGGGGAAAVPANLSEYKMNPYMQQMGDGLQQQFNDNLQRNTLPGLRGGAMAAGGVGGSRQGIAEGLAAAGSNTGAANAITGMYGQDYNNQMNRNLQQYQGDQSFALGNANVALGYSGQANQYDLGRRNVDLGYQNSNNSYDLGRRNNDLGFNNSGQQFALGMGNLGLGYQNSNNAYDLGRTGQDQQFYTQQRGLDLQATGLGANLYGLGDQGQQRGIQDASNVYNPYTGYGTSTTGGGGSANYGAAIGNGLATYDYMTKKGP